MNDFDFEELDKAVTNLATKVPGEPTSTQVPAPPKANAAMPSSAPVETKPAPAAADAVANEPRPEPAAASTPATPSEAPAIRSASTPAKHRLGDTRSRRGSFMDIVPPAPRKPATRVGVSVQPVSKRDEIVPEASVAPPAKVESDESDLPDLSSLKLDLDIAPKTSTPVAEPKPETSAEPKPAEPQSTPKQAEDGKKSGEDVAWPDPLDFNDAPSKSVEPVKAEPESTEPVSPFLAEAKVEKRPLGAFSNFKPASEPKPEPSKPVEEKADESQDELTPQADGTFEEPKKEKAPLPPKEGENSEDKEPTKPDLHGAAMMAIPDQYRPEPKATDKTTRPVYDTKEYHPPLVEAAGHEHRGGGSMWGKIFVALVALALIAVAGYFAYIYLIQR